MTIWLDPPFNMLISGITNCGKTHYVLDLIEKCYFKKFDYIIIYCPTYIANSTYNRKWIAKNDCVLIIDMNYVDLNTLLEITIEVFSNVNMKKKCNTLFLIDDCANSHGLKNKKICFL